MEVTDAARTGGAREGHVIFGRRAGIDWLRREKAAL